MTIYHAVLMHTPGNPFKVSGAMQIIQDGGIVVIDGLIHDIGDYLAMVRKYPDQETHSLMGGIVVPGFIDTHVHFPQVRVVGGLGMPLLEWLDKNTLPEEARLIENSYARAVAKEFTQALAQNGTTTALIFGSHFASAVDILFEEASKVGIRAVAGQVVSDRMLRDELHTTPEKVYQEGKILIEKWHSKGRNLYAVTPRFSLSASEGILEACSELMNEFPGLRFTSHINENLKEVEVVKSLFPGAKDYLDTYQQAGLIGRNSILAHSIHPSDRELVAMAEHDCSASHCPCSNSALGSGFFPLKRHLDAGVRVALGTDVGGGTGFSMLKEGLQAYFMQQLMREDGFPLSPEHLLYLATSAGAEALNLQDIIGDFSIGKRFDAVWISPRSGTPLRAVYDHSDDAGRLLAATFASGSSDDVAQVWVDGQIIWARL